MGYQLPGAVDVYQKVSVFLAGTLPLIGAGEVMALDFDARRVGLMVLSTGGAATDFVAYREVQPITAANCGRFVPAANPLIFDFPPRNQMFIAAATAAAEIRITEFIMQPFPQAVGRGADHRIRSGVQNVS